MLQIQQSEKHCQSSVVINKGKVLQKLLYDVTRTLLQAGTRTLGALVINKGTVAHKQKELVNPQAL